MSKRSVFPLNFKTLDKKPALGERSVTHSSEVKDMAVRGAEWMGMGAGQRDDWKEARARSSKEFKALWKKKD